MKAGAAGRVMRGRWLKFLDSAHGAGVPESGVAEEVFEELDRRYCEEQRHYHNWAHIAACLDELEITRSLALHPVTVELALWFHDAVYVAGAPDNEQRSARMARDAAQRMNLAPAIVQEVEDLVLSTRYLIGDETEKDGSTRLCPRDRVLMRDIDLSILGKPPAEFDRYEEAIRREYGFVPDAERWKRRIAILEVFLALPRIYETEHFAKRYEWQARRNLGRSVSRLRKLLTG
jgi:predicted metal-dependent HD superfamily phosphohydrolase